MHKLHEKLEKLTTIEEKLTCLVEEQLCANICDVDTNELGEVIDMIKDLSEAKKDCTKAKYYETVTEAMLSAEGQNERYGYDNWRYASGRFAPKGQGHYDRSGYPMLPMTGMHYPPFDIRYRDLHSEMPYDGENYRMGYDGERGVGAAEGDARPGRKFQSGTNIRYGYSDRDEFDPRYGKAYNDYQKSRRGYTASSSQKDKEEMDRHAKEHMADTLMTIKEIWNNADIDLKKRMKTDLTQLVSEMTV